MSARWTIAALAIAGCTKATSPPPPPAIADAAPAAPDAAAPAAAPQAAGPLLVVRGGMVILGPPRGATGPARLDGGAFPIDEDGPMAEHGRYGASRAVDLARVPAETHAWVGRELRLGGPGVACVATVTALRVYGETYGLDEDLLAVDEDEAELAAAVLAGSRPVLVGVLAGACALDAAWAVPATSRPPSPWRFGGPITAPGGAVTLTLDEGGDECPDRASYRLHAGARTLLRGRGRLDLRDAVDSDGDGWPELVLGDGVLVPDVAAQRYRRVEAIRVPPDWYACIE